MTLYGNDADSPKGALFSCGDDLPRKECHRFTKGTLIGADGRGRLGMLDRRRMDQGEDGSMRQSLPG